MLAAAPGGRMSQLLPTVKCSNCSNPVPVNELTDHVCPPVPSLPKPAVTPAAATALLPPHLQHRITPTDRLRINTSDRAQSPIARSRLTPSPAPSARSISTSPLRPRANPSADFRTRRPSNAASTSSYAKVDTPTTARPNPPPSYPLGPPPREQLPPPPPLRDPYPRSTPSPQIPEPDTKIGGEAGMAGVGRRGFAAAARAAMFTVPADRPMGPQPRRDRDNLTPYLNTDLPSRTNETPPLSPGSGNSSHSPGVSPYPQSPVGYQGPSPERYDAKSAAPPPPSHKINPSVDRGLPTSPASLRKMPFDKSRNQPPGVVIPNSIPSNNSKEEDTPSTARQQQNFPPPPPARPPRESDASFSLYSSASRSHSNGSSASRPVPTQRRPPSPTSDSGSDYGGLAYADSTDYEDDEPPAAPETTSTTIKGKANPPPPLPLTLTSSILRSGSTASSSSMSIISTSHVRFPSSAVRRPSESSTSRRKGSMSSVSSSGSAVSDEQRKSNSAAVAQALGLSQAAPGSYARLGGPGVGMGGRGGRSASASGGSRGAAVHSRGGGGGSMHMSMGTMEREVKNLLDDKERDEAAKQRDVEDRRAGLSKSKSTGKQRVFAVGEGVGEGANVRVPPLSAKNPGSNKEVERNGAAAAASGAGASSSSSSSSLAKTSLGSKSSAESGGKEKKERVKKPKICLKCDRKIEDGRWVAVDNGGVLCEKCWKHMYLPKCRRCNLPIEKAAVSSADGQLKGKYHRECFNCHTCQKPFPDKSFYVFDGKPLCAYHYHEANDSLCSAALCGQPIEGPCAVSHTGDRYHPEHMLCEYAGAAGCAARLAEYWEVDGRMLCERHAHAASKVGGSDDEEGEEEWVQSSRKMKRVTRFIDLAGGLPSGGLR